jgi:hypothetical protein
MLSVFIPALANPSAAGTFPLCRHFIQLLVLLKVFLHHPLPQLVDNLTGFVVLLDKCPQLIQLPIPKHLFKTYLRLPDKFCFQFRFGLCR